MTRMPKNLYLTFILLVLLMLLLEMNRLVGLLKVFRRGDTPVVLRKGD